MAQKMGKGLGRGKILLRPLPWQRQEASTLNPATQGSLLFSGATRNNPRKVDIPLSQKIEMSCQDAFDINQEKTWPKSALFAQSGTKCPTSSA
jgi:hypothetical protein